MGMLVWRKESRRKKILELGGLSERNTSKLVLKADGRVIMIRNGHFAQARQDRKTGKVVPMSCKSPYLILANPRAHLLSLFGLKASVNTSPILLVPPPSPPSLPLPTQALWAQLAFEELNTPAFSMVPASLASLFALGATTGIVLHIGRDRSEITIVTDSVIRWECSTTVDVGYADCEVWLEDLLMKDMDLDKNLQMNLGGDGTWEAGQKEKLVKEVAHVIWTECTGEDLEVPGAEAGSKALAAVNASAQEDDSSFDVAKK
jgi:actin-related protein 9